MAEKLNSVGQNNPNLQVSTVVQEAVEYWRSQVVIRGNPDIDDNFVKCPWSHCFVPGSISGGYSLENSALESFRSVLCSLVMNALQKKETVVLATAESGPMGLLLEAATFAGIPDDLFPGNTLMCVTLRNSFVVKEPLKRVTHLEDD